MGFFSWKTSDTDRSIPNIYSKRDTFPVYVLIPEEFGGGYIEEYQYNGYGDFGGRDIYELVVDWNKSYVATEHIPVPVKEHWDDVNNAELYYKMRLSEYSIDSSLLKDYLSNKDESYMVGEYGEDYKRHLGMSIACNDELNAALKYPIKIVEDKSISYDDASPSVFCSLQGYFYDDAEE